MFLVWKRSCVVLILWVVEEMWEITFFQLWQSKGFWKDGQWHLKERRRVNKWDAVKGNLKNFTSAPELLYDTVLAMILFQDEIAIIPLEIMRQYTYLSRVVFSQGVQSL